MKYQFDDGSIYEVADDGQGEVTTGNGVALRQVSGPIQPSNTPWWQDDAVQQRAQRLAQSYGAISTSFDANKTARDQEAASILGIPQETMLYAGNDIRQAALTKAQSIQNSPNDWMQFVQQYPATAQYLAQSKNMAVSHDDLPSLSSMEWTWQNISASYQLGELERERAQLELPIFMGTANSLNDLSATDQQRITTINQKMQELSGKITDQPWSLAGIGANLGGMGSMLKMGIQYGEAGAAIGAAATAEAGGVGGLVGAPIGFESGIAGYMGETAASNIYHDLLNRNVDSTRAKYAARAVGEINVALGAVGVPALAKLFPGGKELYNNVVNKAVADVIANPDSSKQVIQTAVKQIMQSIGTMSGITMSSESANIMAEKAGGVNKDTIGQSAERIGKAGLSAVPAGAAFGVLPASLRSLQSLQRLTEESKTANRSTAAVAEFINQLAGDTPTGISGRELRQYLVSAEADRPGAAADIMGKLNITANDVDEAAELGGKVSVKPGELLTLGKQQLEALKNDVSIGDEPTAREIADRQEQLKEVLSRQPEEAEGEEIPRTMDEELEITPEKNVIEENEDYKEQVADIERTVNEELDRAKEVQDKMSGFGFSLQLFGSKDPAEIAKRYLGGKLEPEAKEVFESLAQDHGFTGQALADAISRPREDIVNERVEQSKQALQSTMGDLPSEGKLNAVAKQSAALRGMAGGEHVEAEKRSMWKMFHDLKEHQKKYIDEIVDFFNKNPGVKGVEQGGLVKNLWGEVTGRFGRQTKNPEWYSEYWKEYGHAPTDKTLREFADKFLSASIDDYSEVKELIADLKGRLGETEEPEAISEPAPTVDRAKQTKEISQRWKDATQKMLQEFDRSKNDEKIRQLKENYSKLKEQHAAIIKHLKDEAEYNARWRDAEANKAAANQRQHQKHDWQMAREWLKAEDVSQRIARQAQVGIKAAMQYARDNIGNKKLNELAPGLYMRQAREAARQSERAYRSGNYQDAAEWKDREMLNHAMALEAGKAAKEVKKIGSYLGKFAKRGQSLIGMPPEYVGQIDALLNRYGLRSDEPLSLNGNRPDDISVFIENKKQDYLDLSFPDSILNGQPKTVKDMTLSEYRDLKDTVAMLAKLGKDETKLTNYGKKVELSHEAAEFGQQITFGKGREHADERGIGAPVKSSWQRASNWALSKFGSNGLVQIRAICRLIDLNKDGGVAQRNISDKIEMALHDALVRDNKTKKAIGQLIAEQFPNLKDLQNFLKQKFTFKNIPGRELTGNEVFSALLNWGNEGNRDRVRKGFGLNDNQMIQIFRVLDDRHVNLAQGIWDYLESYWPEIRQHQIDLKGLDPKKVETSGFDIVTNKGDTAILRGGYYPIEYDPQKSGDTYINSHLLNELYKQRSSSYAATQQGYLKARARTNDKPVLLDLSVLATHLKNVNYDLAMRQAIIEVNRFLKQDEVKAGIEDAFGVKTYGNFGEWLRAVATDQHNTVEPGDGFFRGIRKRTTMAALGINIKAFPDFIPTNVLQACWDLGFRPTAQAFFDFAANPREAIQRIQEKSVFMANRTKTLDRDLYDFASRVFDNDNHSIATFLMSMHGRADEVVSYPVWDHVYNDAIQKGADEAEAIQRADSTIKRVFGSALKSDLAQIQRGTEAHKLFTMFYSWYSGLFNRYWLSAKMAGIEWDRGDTLQAASTMTRAALYGWVLPSIVSGFVGMSVKNVLGQKAKDDKDKWKEFGSEIAAYPLASIPMARDTANFAIEKALGLNKDYSISPAASLLEALGTAAADTYQLASKRIQHQPFKPGEKEKTVENIAKATPYIGIPGTPLAGGYPHRINDWVFNFYDWLNRNGDHAVTQAIKDLFTREHKQQAMK